MTMMSPFPQVLEEAPRLWQITLVNSETTAALDQWTSLSITEDHDGVRVEVEVNGLDPMAAYMRMLTTDLLLFRNTVLAYRVRVADAEDTMTRDAYTVRFSCVSYEKLLERRIIHDDVGSKGTWVVDTFDIDAAWSLINYTQLKATLGILRGTTAAGVRRQRSLNTGDTILESINNFAEADAGFDWWIDANKVWWAQKPRRGALHDVEWRWGAEIAEIVRQSAMEDYASLVMATGAQNVTNIPNPPNPDTVYPPPPAQTVQLAAKPLGLWEVAVSYSDVITAASLLEKANWHLQDLSLIRATYKLTIESGIWSPAFGIGDRFMMRVGAGPRLNVRVPVRIEEIQINMTGDGEEQVSMSVRAEQPETFVTPLPLPSMMAMVMAMEGVPLAVSAVLTEPFNDFANWARSGSPAAAIVPGRTGTGAQLQNLSSNASIAAYSIAPAFQAQWIVVGTAWKIDSYTNDPAIVEFYSDNNTTFHCAVKVRSDGSLGFFMGGILLGWSAAGLISLNTWNFIEARIKLADSPNGSWEIRLNGVLVASNLAADTKNGGTKTVFDAIRLTTHSLGTITAVYDDLYVDTGTTSPSFRGDVNAPVPPAAGGRTVPRHRLHAWDNVAALLRTVDTRLGRQERSPSA